MGFDTGLWKFACVILPPTNYKARTKPFCLWDACIHLSIFSALLCLSYINISKKTNTEIVLGKFWGFELFFSIKNFAIFFHQY